MEEKQCLLVIIGATKDGKKELVALEGGFRESELSWTEVLVDPKHRGLKEAPELAVGDGALGFWKALAKVYDNTRWQRCWVHKIANKGSCSAGFRDADNVSELSLALFDICTIRINPLPKPTLEMSCQYHLPTTIL
jgi:transposase-like protein